MTDARARWAELSARQRGALIRAVRRGERVAEADRPVAAEIAQRELDRLATQVRPGRLRAWRVLQAVAAALCALVAVAAVTAGAGGRAAGFGAAAVLFASSALLARRRLDRQVARLAAARDANS